MKKLFSIIMSLLMVVCFMPTMAFATDITTAPMTDTTWDNNVITYNNQVMTIIGSNDADNPLTITIKGTVTLKAEVELKGYVKLVGDGEGATIEFVDPDTTSSDKAAVGHRAVLKPSANVGASDYDSSCTTFENLILKQDTNQGENVDISPITMQAYSCVVLNNVTFNGWTKIDEKYSIISALNGKLTLKNGVNFSGCGDTKHIAMTPTSPNEGSTQLPIVLDNFSTTTDGGIVLTYGVAGGDYDEESKTLKNVDDPIWFASGATKNNVDNFKFKIRVNLNTAVYLERQTIYAEGNLYTGSGTVQPDRTKWEIDLGNPTGVTVSGGELRQFVATNNGTFNSVTITPSEGKTFTGVNISALTTALASTGLTAEVNDAGAIVISGAPNKDVDLSKITWPTPSSSKTVNLGNANALEANGLAVEGNLIQAIADGGNFQDVTIKALDGKMPLTSADVKKINDALGDGSPLGAKLSDGKITISQKYNAKIDSKIDVDIVDALSVHKDVVAKIGDEPYDDLKTAIGAADENGTVAKVSDKGSASGATLKKGATLTTEKGSFTAKDADATIDVATDGAVTLTNGKLKVSKTGSESTASAKVKSGSTEYAVSGEAFEVSTADGDAAKLTVDTGKTATVDGGASYSNGTFNLSKEGNTTIVTGEASGTVTGKAVGGESDTIGIVDASTRVAVAEDGSIKLVSGEGKSAGTMTATITGVGDKSFAAVNSNSYTVDTQNKTLILNSGDDTTPASVKMGGKVTFTGKENNSFTLGKSGDNTTATIPAGASVKGKDNVTITGVAKGETGKNDTKVEIDSSTGALTLVAGKGKVTGPATVKVAVKNNDGDIAKPVDVAIPQGKTYTIDADKVPPTVGKLEANETITLGGITYTAGAANTEFQIGVDKLVNTGDKATVPAKTSAIITLGDGADSPSITVPSGNTGATTITKGGTKGKETTPTTVQIPANGKFTLNGKDYVAGTEGATFVVDEANKTASLKTGNAVVKAGGSLDVKTGNAVVPVKNNGEGNITVEADESTVKSSATVPNGGSVTIGLGENAKTYPSKEDNTKFVFDKDGKVTLDSGTTELVKDQSITAGVTDATITNPTEGKKLTVKSDSTNKKGTVTVEGGGSVKVGDTTYANASGQDEMVIDLTKDAQNKTKATITKGAAKVNPGKTLTAKNVDVKNTGAGNDITVSAGGKVTIPAGGQADIGNAKITDVKQDTTFTIGDDGKANVGLGKGETVTINGVTYTGGEGEPAGGTLTIDPATGKVTGITGTINTEIDEKTLEDKNFSYELIPGQSVTIGKYVYTAPEGGTAGDVTIKDRTDTKGKALNPAVVLKNADGKVEVSLKDTPAIKTTYTAANANTKFAMAASDADTTRINLLDNGEKNASDSSALKFTDKASHTVNGVTYQAQTVKDADGTTEKAIEYTVTYGTKTETVTADDGDTTKITNCNTVSVESGTKVVATMNAKAAINVGSGKVGDHEFDSQIPFTAGNSGASIIIDNNVNGKPTISGSGSYLTPIKDKDGNVTGYEVTRYYSRGYVPTQTTDKEDEKTDEEIKAEQDAKAATLTGKIQIKARSIKTKKGNIKVTVKITKGANSFKALEDMGYTLKYRFYRSTKKSASYKAKFETYKKPYTNTDAKKGVRYYYKARVLVYDAQGKLIAKTKLGKCWYATRIR